ERLGYCWAQAGPRFVRRVREPASPLPPAQDAITSEAVQTSLPPAAEGAETGKPPQSRGLTAPEIALFEDASVVELESFPLMRHVTLNWEVEDPDARQRIEAELNRALAEVRTPENPAAGWFLSFSISGFFLMVGLLLILLVLSYYVRHCPAIYLTGTGLSNSTAPASGEGCQWAAGCVWPSLTAGPVVSSFGPSTGGGSTLRGGGGVSTGVGGGGNGRTGGASPVPGSGLRAAGGARGTSTSRSASKTRPSVVGRRATTRTFSTDGHAFHGNNTKYPVAKNPLRQLKRNCSAPTCQEQSGFFNPSGRISSACTASEPGALIACPSASRGSRTTCNPSSPG